MIGDSLIVLRGCYFMVPTTRTLTSPLRNLIIRNGSSCPWSSLTTLLTVIIYVSSSSSATGPSFSFLSDDGYALSLYPPFTMREVVMMMMMRMTSSSMLLADDVIVNHYYIMGNGTGSDEYRKRFDYTSTYELDSTIPVTCIHPHWDAEYYYGLKPASYVDKKGDGSPGAAATFTSNCANGGAQVRETHTKGKGLVDDGLWL